MRRIAWVWVLVAFVLGALPGGGAAWWVWNESVGARQVLASRNSELHAENAQLINRLNSAEATVSTLNARLAAASTAAAAASSAGTSTGTSTGAPSGPPAIKERSVSAAEIAPGKELTLTVKLTGHAARVNMRIAGGAFDKTYFLGRESYNSTGEVWTKTIEAPSGAGTYHYYAIAYDDAGTKYPMAGTTGFTFVVK